MKTHHISYSVVTLIVAAVIVGIVSLFYVLRQKELRQFPTQIVDVIDEPLVITSFEECVAAGNGVMESYPEQCAANGQTFVRDIGNQLILQDEIRITNPEPGQKIQDVVTIEGVARGFWFFEASMPVSLVTSEGRVLARHFVEAQDEWMTEDFVKLQGELFYPVDVETKLDLLFEKANPSGLPENAAVLRIPITLIP